MPRKRIGEPFEAALGQYLKEMVDRFYTKGNTESLPSPDEIAEVRKFVEWAEGKGLRVVQTRVRTPKTPHYNPKQKE